MASPKKISIFVTASGGQVQTSFIHHDAVDIAEFGKVSAPRVSDVEFDEADQKWVARLRDGREIARNKSRDVVLEEERTVIEDMLRRGEPIPAYDAPVNGVMTPPFSPPKFGAEKVGGNLSAQHLQ